MGSLPAALTHLYGFERRLNQKEAAVDAAICVRTNIGRAILAGSHHSQLAPHLLVDFQWQRVRKLAQAWEDTDSAWHPYIRELWLEFDQAQLLEPVPIPGMFVGLNAAQLNPQLTQHIVNLMSGSLDIRSPATLPYAERFLGSLSLLPPTARLFQVGAMLSRATTNIRVCVSGLNAVSVVKYLRAIQWINSFGHPDSRALVLCSMADDVTLHLDLGPTLGGTVGLELYVNRGEHSRVSALKWAPVLDYLTKCGMCLDSERQLLLAWGGTTMQRGRLGRTSTAFHKIVQHVKLSLAPTLTSAKVYFGIVTPPN